MPILVFVFLSEKRFIGLKTRFTDFYYENIAWSRIFMWTILQLISYIESKTICHCNIKNIQNLIRSNSPGYVAIVTLLLFFWCLKIPLKQHETKEDVKSHLAQTRFFPQQTKQRTKNKLDTRLCRYMGGLVSWQDFCFVFLISLSTDWMKETNGCVDNQISISTLLTR